MTVSAEMSAFVKFNRRPDNKSVTQLGVKSTIFCLFLYFIT